MRFSWPTLLIYRHASCSEATETTALASMPMRHRFLYYTRPLARPTHPPVRPVTRTRSMPRVMLGHLCVVLGSGLIVAGLASLVSHREPSIDRHALKLLAFSRGSFLIDIAKPLSKAAPIVLAVVVLAVIVLLIRRDIWRQPIALGGGFLLCSIGAHLAKTAAERPRPSGALITAGGFSFPSTSSALCIGIIATAMAAAPLISDRRRRAFAIAAGCAMAFTAGLLFLAIRVHYLTDVVAGWAFGIGVFTLCDLTTLTIWRVVPAGNADRR
jgi:membrane-associated phospholipid phosphatase